MVSNNSAITRIRLIHYQIRRRYIERLSHNFKYTDNIDRLDDSTKTSNIYDTGLWFHIRKEI